MAASARHVSLEFVGNDEVVKHIVVLDEVSAKKPRISKVQTLVETPSAQRPVRASRKKVNYSETLLGLNRQDSDSDTSEDDESDEGEEEDGEDKLNKTPEVLLNEEGVKGADVYQFKRNKRAGQMAQLARKCATPVSTKKQKKETPAPTPKKTEPARRVTRRSSRRALPDLVDDSDTSDSSTSDDQGDDDKSSTHSKDSVSSMHRSTRGTRGGAKGGKTPRGTTSESSKRKTRGEIDVPNLAEEYFSAHAGVSLTSDHTLSRLAVPQMDQQQVSKALSSAPSSHHAQITELYQEYEGLFNKWMFQLSNGFNLMLYGLGSKRCLLDKFRAEMLSTRSHVVVNGFFPGLTVKSILNSITDDVLGHQAGFRNLAEQTEFIHESLEEREEPLFLIIHNIDGMMLRGYKSQTTLASLSQLSSVHVIGTIDHINAPLIWDQSKSSSFYWVWYEVTTFEPYTEETSYENSLLVQQSGVLALSSLTHVLRSLTPNARGIFNLLVEYQLAHKDDSTYQGLSFQDLYQKCREAFLVNSELTLRAQLTEFRDHKLIRSKKGLDGVEFLLIAVDNSTLVEFQQQEEV